MLSITGSANPLKVLAYADLKPTSHSFQPVARVSEGRSGTNIIKGGGEKSESREAEAVREKGTAHEGEHSWISIRTRHPASLSAGSATALNGLGDDPPVQDEPGPRIPWQPGLKLVVLWTPLGVFNNLLACVHT